MERVAITGLGVLCAAAEGTEAFVKALRKGRTGIVAPPDGGPAAAEVGEVELDGVLAARAAGPWRDAAVRLTRRAPKQLRAAVAAAVEAWTRAELPGGVPADRIGLVVAGSNLTGRQLTELHARYGERLSFVPPRAALRLPDTDHVGTLSELFGVTGEGYTLGAASATGNVAIAHGARLVAGGELDVCLVVGAMTELSQVERHAYLNLGAMARGPAGPPFTDWHAGFVPGQGAACLVLESARSAGARGAPEQAEVAGWDVRLAAGALAAPDRDAEAATMRAALRHAGVAPAEVTYVNTHGTGSPQGDDTELAALADVFGPSGHRPWANATKGLTGHCLSAAGVVEAVAVVLQMRGGFLHPGAGTPTAPQVRFTGSSAESVHIAYALSNGFGFGGFNSGVVFRARR